MSNFLGLVFSTLKEAGIDTKNMSIDEAIEEYRNITEKNEKSPKDENGASNKSSNKNTNLTNGTKSAKIILPKQEYAEICSAINQKNARYKGNIPKFDSILYGNFKYFYSNGKDFGEFTILHKVPISSQEWRVK